jgi:hypothetical protein
VSRKKIRRIRGIVAHYSYSRRIAIESTFPQRGMRIYEEDGGEEMNVWIGWLSSRRFGRAYGTTIATYG